MNLASPAQIKWVSSLVYNRDKSREDFMRWAETGLDKTLASRIIHDLKDYIKFNADTEVVTRKQQYARELLAQAGYNVTQLPQ